MKFESINWRNVVNQITPWLYRVDDFNDWLRATISTPLQTVSDKWWKFYQFYDNILIHNAQTIYLEKYLNDLFDDTNRGIYIENTYQSRVYLYNDAEGFNEPHLYNESEGEDGLYIYNENEGSTDADFIVYVPSSVGLITDTDFLNRITGEVGRYVFAGVIFQVLNY